MPTWPASLPQKPAAESYRELPPLEAVEHEMDAGPNKPFGAGSGGPRAFELLLHLTEAQVETLDVFFRSDLRDGEVAFDWVEPRSQAAQKFLMMAPPVYRHIGGDRWTAALILETRPPAVSFGGRATTTTAGTGQLAVGASFAGAARTGTLGDGELS